jgi:hypothetical protein
MKKILFLLLLISFTSCEQNELDVTPLPPVTEPIVLLSDSMNYVTNYREKYIGIWKDQLEIANNTGDGTKIVKHQSVNKIIMEDFYDTYTSSNKIDLILEITPNWLDSLNKFDNIYIQNQTFVLYNNQSSILSVTISGTGGYFFETDTTHHFILNLYFDYESTYPQGFTDGQKQLWYKKIL